ncbi:hypothetical protein KXD93_16320 [Mucilaginibacter sp. BJC16-A38]|uniref:hypothetical protein n=1 Tax=Mucilaginibacter phenanthrenivorans TaxID=1234842 RepID=UPI0021576F68|nr:hypothetical protein [Mucilaginibacter phenanthrenivorans]MCR8559224.1 hypothetical protein [Mucilaginibacter phenanthrenivorans]
MGLIREPLDVDFTVEPHVLTEEEKIAISKYIREYKLKETGSKQSSSINGKTSARKREKVKS